MWMILIGASIGVVVGLASATAITATGFTEIEAPPAPTTTATSATPTPQATTPAPTEAETPAEPQPTLEGPSKVPPGQRFGLSGQIPSAKGGAVLQVQVKDADRDWIDFPVTVTVREGGSFSTELWTSRTGERQFRLVDRSSGKMTPAITVTIG